MLERELPSDATDFIRILIQKGTILRVEGLLTNTSDGESVYLSKGQLHGYLFGIKKNPGVTSLLTVVESEKGVHDVRVGYFPVYFGTSRDMASNKIGLSYKYKIMTLRKEGNKKGISLICVD